MTTETILHQCNAAMSSTAVGVAAGAPVDTLQPDKVPGGRVGVNGLDSRSPSTGVGQLPAWGETDAACVPPPLPLAIQLCVIRLHL